MQRLIENQRDLVNWVREQAGRLDIAVAFWGQGAMDDLQLAGKNVRLVLELDSGGTNPSEVRMLINAFPNRVRVFPRLHAKAYITSTSVLIGSANASATGLGVEGAESTKWTELGLLVDNPDTVKSSQRWFNDLWEKGQVITEPMLVRAERQWVRTRSNRAYGIEADVDLLTAASLDPRSFEGRLIFVVVTVSELSAKGRKAVKQRSADIGQEAYGWESWPDIPTDAWLISFTDDPVDGLRADDPLVYRTTSEYGKSLMKWVEPVRSGRIDGFCVPGIRDWKQRLEAYKRRNLPAWRKDGISVPLDKFLRETDD